MITVHLVRHAESIANTQRHLVGGRSTETPLSAEGEQQARRLGELLQQQPVPQRVISSPAIRARETARLSLAGVPNAPLIEISDAVHEMSQGVFEGQPRDTVYTPEIKARIEALGKDFALPGEGAESMNDVANRIEGYLQQLVAQAEDGDVIYIYTHGIAICSYLAKLFGWTQQRTFDETRALANASVTTLEFSSDREPPVVDSYMA